MNAKVAEIEQRPEGGTLTSSEKAAIIISALPHEEAANLLQKLGPVYVPAYVAATRRLRHIPMQVLEQVILEFLEGLDDNSIVLGPDTTRDVLSRIMSADEVAGIVGGSNGPPRTVWDRIRDIPDAAIASFVAGQHPRAASIVMGRLPPEKAAAVIDLLDANTAERAVAMLERPAALPPRILSIVEEAIESELLGTIEGGEPPEVFVGAVFDSLTDRTRDPLMKRLEDKTPDFAKAVARQMFLFDDIPARMDPGEVPVLTREIDQSVLCTALAYAASRRSETTEFILSSIPRRMAEQIRETMETTGTPDDETEGQIAEGEVIQQIRRLAEAGKIKLKVS